MWEVVSGGERSTARCVAPPTGNEAVVSTAKSFRIFVTTIQVFTGSGTRLLQTAPLKLVCGSTLSFDLMSDCHVDVCLYFNAS